MSLTKFPTETDWDAIVQEFCLDIVEEEQFREYVETYGSKDLTLDDLELLCILWQDSIGGR